MIIININICMYIFMDYVYKRINYEKNCKVRKDIKKIIEYIYS